MIYEDSHGRILQDLRISRIWLLSKLPHTAPSGERWLRRENKGERFNNEGVVVFQSQTCVLSVRPTSATS